MVRILAQILGVIAMIIAVLSFQKRENKRFFLWQATGAVLFAIHFFLLGAYVGSILNLICVVRGLLFAYAPKKYRTCVLIGISLVLAAVVVLTYSGWPSLCVLAACLAGTFVMWLDRDKIIRYVQFFIVSPGWLIYNIYYFSIGGILTESFNLVSVLIYFIRFGFGV